MSLVAYDASSSDEEEDAAPEAEAAVATATGEEARPPPPPPTPVCLPQRQNEASTSLNIVSLPAPSLDKLPDVSALLASPSVPSQQSVGTDHSSRVAAAMVENASRKRESNGSAFQDPRNKLPRLQSSNPRNARNTTNSLLTPPQLSGRSNVVTEDLSKLFVNRRKEWQ